jgi:hypothetical protein
MKNAYPLERPTASGISENLELKTVSEADKGSVGSLSSLLLRPWRSLALS